MTDIEIAAKFTPQPITRIAAKLGLSSADIDTYGDFKAKIKKVPRGQKGKLILVTAINPTAAGEGKTTVSIGLADGLSLLGKNVCLALREPSLGPVFGVKGGATGGGYSQVIPMEDINLHFTGDFHAITSANNLLCALIDNSIYQGNPKNIDANAVLFKRCMDMNDRALRQITVGQGGKTNGIPRADGFNITAASEIMAIMCLARDLDDLKQRLGEIAVAKDYAGNVVRAKDIGAQNAMAVLLKEAIKPNLVQTLAGTPAIIHCGPFANIAHGCNSIIATKTALGLADYAVTEAGFGADLGAEKFIDIKCRVSGLRPDAVVIVATVRALKLHGGAQLENLQTEDLDALTRGIANLEKHIDSITKVFNLPAVVAVNKFTSDTEAELSALIAAVRAKGVKAVVANVWGEGGKGAVDLAEEVLNLTRNPKVMQFAYSDGDTLVSKIEKIATKVYGAAGVDFSEQAIEDIKFIENNGGRYFPAVIAKTQYSLSDKAELLGRPKNFRLYVRGVELRAGAQFAVVLAGNVMLMPGLGKKPAALGMDIDNDGNISGLF